MVEQSRSMSSPALISRAPAYPFGATVPSRVRMLRTCYPTFAAVDCAHILPIAFVGQAYECYVGEDGEIAVFLPYDQILHIEPDSFDIVHCHDTDGALPDGPIAD